MSNTCVQTVNTYSLRECGEKATHIVRRSGRNPREMCVRHAAPFAGFSDYGVSPISKGVNYVADAHARLVAELPGLDPELEKLYALLVLVKGKDVTLKDVHDAWSVWRNETNPYHKSLVPFENLTVEVQALDAKYAEGIAAATE